MPALRPRPHPQPFTLSLSKGRPETLPSSSKGPVLTLTKGTAEGQPVRGEHIEPSSLSLPLLPLTTQVIGHRMRRLPSTNARASKGARPQQSLTCTTNVRRRGRSRTALPNPVTFPTIPYDFHHHPMSTSYHPGRNSSPAGSIPLTNRLPPSFIPTAAPHLPRTPIWGRNPGVAWVGTLTPSPVCWGRSGWGKSAAILVPLHVTQGSPTTGSRGWRESGGAGGTPPDNPDRTVLGPPLPFRERVCYYGRMEANAHIDRASALRVTPCAALPDAALVSTRGLSHFSSIHRDFVQLSSSFSPRTYNFLQAHQLRKMTECDRK